MAARAGKTMVQKHHMPCNIDVQNSGNQSIRSTRSEPANKGVNVPSEANTGFTNLEKEMDCGRDVQNGHTKPRAVRKATRGLNTQKYTRTHGEKPNITIPEGINRPVGLHASKHASQIGVQITLHAPLQVENRSKIPDDKKEELFKRLIIL